MVKIKIKDPFRFTCHINNQTVLGKIKNITYQRSKHFPRTDCSIIVETVLLNV